LDFGQKEIDHRLLLAIQPTSQDDHEQLPGLEDEIHASTGIGVGEWNRIVHPRRLSISPDRRWQVEFTGNWGKDLRFGGIF